jgi:eukaryotic-like serine/threonine-protein kinase
MSDDRRDLGRPVLASRRCLSSRASRVGSARFAPDGETIVYGAAWGASPSELFSTRVGATGSRPLAGSTPREVLEGVLDADWSPDGKDLAAIHVVGERYRLEYPIGRVLYAPEPPTWMSALRISPSGDKVAFVEHPVAADRAGGVSVLARDGRRQPLATGFAAIDSVFWQGADREVWFGGTRESGSPQQVHAVTLLGHERLVAETAGGFTVLDVARDGRVLGERHTSWTETRARARGAIEEAELPAADLSFLSDLSDDGRTVLGTDTGLAGGPNFSFYVQKTDGSPAVWLGEGDGQALSSDGRFALAVLPHAEPPQLLVVPTGAGETRTLEPGEVVRYRRAVWDRSGARAIFAGVDAEGSERIYLQDVTGGPPRAVTAEGVTLPKIGRPVSPDGRFVLGVDADGATAAYPLAGGEPSPISHLTETDVPLCWTPDGRELIVARYDETPPRIERVEIASGRSRVWNRLGHAAPSGLLGEHSTRVLVSPDGESYAYSYLRNLGDLYLTSPLR